MNNREGACGFIASTISPFCDCCPRSITGRIKADRGRSSCWGPCRMTLSIVKASKNAPANHGHLCQGPRHGSWGRSIERDP